jgi:NTP pyrophosphohydrolases including oxidative damage repair enzymes
MKEDLQTNPWRTLSVEEKYDNPWIKITHRDVINPTGGPGIYGVVHFKNVAIGVLPLDKNYNTWIVGQYRYTIEEYSWEIPEGGGLVGTDPLDSAKRELKEETGIEAANWTEILDMHTSNSVTDEYGLAYVAQDLTFGEAEPEDTEDLIVKKLPFTELYQMVMDGKIKDSLSMVTILKAKALIDLGEI